MTGLGGVILPFLSCFFSSTDAEISPENFSQSRI
jgi:hypothetical protein